MTRILNVTRMQFVNKSTFVWIPLIILGATFLMSVIIFALIPTTVRSTAAGAKPRSGTSSPSESWR